MGLSLIVAMTKDRVIGKDNDLPWPMIKEDMKHFKKTTKGHPVIMGRKTWDSIPEKFRPLPGRLNIVVTRNADLKLDGATVFNHVDEAIDFALEQDPDSFVIGGSSIYEAALPKAGQIYLTIIKGSYEGDTHFPELDLAWESKKLSETDKAAFYLYTRV